MTPTSEFVEAMLVWLNDRIAPIDFTITSDTPLFEGGLIDSIRVLELIAWTEEAIGAVIPDVRIRMDNFRTVARIAEVFVQERNDAAA
jgi:acyl carrier protein